MGLNDRDLYTFAIVAGLWLRDKRPPVVGEAIEISKDCSIYTSAPLFMKSLRRLVKEGWLTVREVEVRRGYKTNRYVPTLKGFVEFINATNSMWKNFVYDILRSLVSGVLSDVNVSPPPLFGCLKKYVDISAVERLGRALALLKRAAELSIVPPRYQELLQAIVDARPIDDAPQELLDAVLSDLSLLECLVEFQLVQSALFEFAMLENESENVGREALDVLKALADTLYKLALYCTTRKGVTVYGEVAEIIKSTISNISV